jgi:hypothetical protein
MFKINLYSWFIQTDTNASLQFLIRLQQEAKKDIDPVLVKKYTKLVLCTDKLVLNEALSWDEVIYCARYFQSMKNELAGRSVRKLVGL